MWRHQGPLRDTVNDHANSGDQHSSTKNTGGKSLSSWKGRNPPISNRRERKVQDHHRAVFAKSSDTQTISNIFKEKWMVWRTLHPPTTWRCSHSGWRLQFLLALTTFNHHFHWLTQAIPTWPTWQCQGSRLEGVHAICFSAKRRASVWVPERRAPKNQEGYVQRWGHLHQNSTKIVRALAWKGNACWGSKMSNVFGKEFSHLFSASQHVGCLAFQAHDPGPRDWYPLLPQLAVHGRVATKIYIPKMNENIWKWPGFTAHWDVH